MWLQINETELFAAPNLLGDAEWVLFLVRRLTEWRRFHFWYQLRDALNSGSSLNSLAFRHSINPLTAIPMQNEVRRLPNDRKDKNLTRLEFVFTFVKTGQWESFIPNLLSHDTTIVLRVAHSTDIHSAISWLIYFVIFVSVVLQYKINAHISSEFWFVAFQLNS